MRGGWRNTVVQAGDAAPSAGPASPDAAPASPGGGAHAGATEREQREAATKAKAAAAAAAFTGARLSDYNEASTHQGRWCFGKTPIQTFLDSLPMAREKQQTGEGA